MLVFSLPESDGVNGKEKEIHKTKTEANKCSFLCSNKTCLLQFVIIPVNIKKGWGRGLGRGSGGRRDWGGDQGG